MKVGIASDHAGYELKEFLIGYFDSIGFEVFDYGCHSPESCDYADVAKELAEGLLKEEFDFGFGVCGSGIGISMALNRHKGIRAGLCWQEEIAELTRLHNDANVCVLPARFVELTDAIKIVDKFLKTEFEGGRHALRVEKLEAL